jgi:hypothetical protein
MAGPDPGSPKGINRVGKNKYQQHMSITHSSWAQLPIQLTNSLSDSLWANAGSMPIPGGFLMTKNDGQFLYAALDMTGDTGDDPGDGDYFWFTFDRNRDGNITPNVDSNYGSFPGNPNKLGRQWYLSPGSWTGLGTDSSTCKMAFESSPNAAAAHRVWKFRFALSDLNVSLAPWWWAPFTRFGIKTHSSTPAQDNNTPANFWMSFAGLHTLYFSRKPVVDPALQGPVIGCVGLIPTTKINPSGRATTAAGYFVYVQNAAFGGLINIIGNAPNRINLWNAGARYIKVLHSEGAGAYADFRTSWYNYHWSVPAGDYVLDTYGPDAANFYDLQDPAVDYSIHDLLFQFDSGRLNNDIHNFQVKFYNAAHVEVATPVQILTLLIDNTVPIVKINAIKHGVATVSACDVVQMTGPADTLSVNFDAYDPAGNMLGWNLYASWGDNQSAPIASDAYVVAKGNWIGVQNQTDPTHTPPLINTSWVPVMTCAHSFTIAATPRVTNGYSYIGYTSVSRFITILK